MFARNPNKKRAKAENKKHRVGVTMNMATKTFKSGKDYSRANGKKICREWREND